jgi:hypothetical protein
MIRAYLKNKHNFRVTTYEAKVHLKNELKFTKKYREELMIEMEELALDLNAAKLLDKSDVFRHYKEMSIYLYPPINGGPGVQYPWGGLKEGYTASPHVIHVTWRPIPENCVFKYELINALTWKFKGSDLAHNEGSPERKPWDKYQYRSSYDTK